MFSNEISGIKTDYYGMQIFNDVKLNDYMTYKAATDTAAAAAADSNASASSDTAAAQ